MPYRLGCPTLQVDALIEFGISLEVCVGHTGVLVDLSGLSWLSGVEDRVLGSCQLRGSRCLKEVWVYIWHAIAATCTVHVYTGQSTTRPCGPNSGFAGRFLEGAVDVLHRMDVILVQKHWYQVTSLMALQGAIAPLCHMHHCIVACHMASCVCISSECTCI